MLVFVNSMSDDCNDTLTFKGLYLTMQEMMALAQKRAPLILQAVHKFVASAAVSMES